MAVKIALLLFLVGILASPAIGLPQTTEPQTGVTLQNVLDTFDQIAISKEEVRQEMLRLKRDTAIVFVPGIMGSSLTSATLGNIWGEGLPNPDRLRLDASLINEDKPSGVKAKLLEQMFGMDFYGEAFGKIKAHAARLKIKAIACGYDWRRDIRWGARDLNDCITEQLGTTSHRLILVGHSMGGLVTMNWNQRHEAEEMSPNHKVIALSIIGSPLEGSCELLRMVQAGYVQPVEDTRVPVDQRAKYYWSRKDKLFEIIRNNLFSIFSGDLRPVILSWPGAMELTPRRAKNDAERVCVKLYNKPPEHGGGDASVVSYYEPDFWQSQVGSDLLLHGSKSYPLPDTLPQVLDKADKFRSSFTVNVPKAPVYLYYSSFWYTPELAPYAPGNRVAIGDWYTREGDGRVPVISARPIKPTIASDVYNVYSVHGDLVNDGKVQQDFFEFRLPLLLQAHTATELIKRLGRSAEIRKLYWEKGGKTPEPNEFLRAYQNRPGEEPISFLAKDAVTEVKAFAAQLCSIPNRCSSYATSRRLLQASLQNKAPQKSVAQSYSGTLARGDLPIEREVIAKGQIGLAYARTQNWNAALGSLAAAESDFDMLPLSYDRTNPGVIAMLKTSVIANLGRALFYAGRCSEAKQHLKQVAETNKFAAEQLKIPCHDRESGLLEDLNKP
jgi:pimeloyl-ACP methyl ester carboxylesterase